MDDDINITGWTGAEEKQVTLRRAQTHRRTTYPRGGDAEASRNMQQAFTVFYCGVTLSVHFGSFYIPDSPCRHMSE